MRRGRRWSATAIGVAARGVRCCWSHASCPRRGRWPVVWLACLLLALLLRRPAVLGLALGFSLAWAQCATCASRHGSTRARGQDAQRDRRGRLGAAGGRRRPALRVRDRARRPACRRASSSPGTNREWRPLAAERLALEVRLRRPRGFANPGGADYEARAAARGPRRHGLRAVGAGASVVAGRTCCGHPCWSRATRSRPRLRAALGERPATGIVAGLSVGLQDALSQEQWRRARAQRHQPPDGDLGHAHRHVRGGRGLAGGARAALAPATRRTRQRARCSRARRQPRGARRMARSPAGRCRRSAR